jgi:parallel beta-helix repeat protein
MYPKAKFGSRRLYILALALTFSVTGISQTTYYIDATSGNDSNNGLSPVSPWRSLTRINNSNLTNGDSVLFKRGEVYYGYLRIVSSGISFASYGTGNKPVISGFTTLTNWSSLSGNIFESPCANCEGKLNMLTKDGVVQAMGRYPNANAVNGGYLPVSTHSFVDNGNYTSSGSITSALQPTFTSFTAGEVVIRKNNWVLDRCLITNQSGQTIFYNSPTHHEPKNGFGYFIQDHPATVDREGEWYYDRNNKKVFMYFGMGDPNSHEVKVGIIDTLVYGYGVSDIVFDNIHFEGADVAGIRFVNSQRITIRNAEFTYSGTEALLITGSSQTLVEGSSFNYTNNNAIRLMDCNFSVVRNNIVKNTGLLAGMGLSNNQQYEGIYLTGTSGLIEFNRVDSTGYSAISFGGEATVVQNNFVDVYTVTIDDGGGIYGWGGYEQYGKRVRKNIILNGIGAPQGTTSTVAEASAGIYLDDWSANVSLEDNSIAYAAQTGIYVHNSHDVDISANTLFDNRNGLSMINNNITALDPIRGMKVKSNIIFSKTEIQPAVLAVSLYNDIDKFGFFDSNYYAKPLDTGGVVFTSFRNEANGFNYSNAGYQIGAWNYQYNKDRYTLPAPITIRPYAITNESANMAVNASFSNNVNNVFSNSSPTGCTTNWVNDGHLDGGALKINFSNSLYAISTHLAIGTVQANKTYIIRFSLQSTIGENSLACFVIRNSNPYDALTQRIKYIPLKTSRTENELLFQSPVTADILLVLQSTDPDGAYYVDNIELREVAAMLTNPDDSIRFVYNETSVVKNVALDGIYMDVKRKEYYSNITLQPFSSAVLMKVPLIALLPHNEKPIARATCDTRHLSGGNLAMLDGSNSIDPDGTIVSYRWRQISGPNELILLDSTKVKTGITGWLPATYSFELIVSDNSGSSAHTVVSIDFSKQRQGAEIRLFPNPVIHNLLQVQVENNFIGDTRIAIFDLTGRRIKEIILFKDKRIWTAEIDVSKLNAAQYFLQVCLPGNKTVYENFIKF